MKAGSLDTRIELRRRVLARDEESGQTRESWPEAYATVWAEKRDLRSREFLAAQQINATISTVFRIRYRSDVLATDRIVLVSDGTQYNIEPPAEIGRRRRLEIMASAVRL